MTTLYHNPRCSKSREAYSLLTERGIEPIIIEYLKEPLNLTQLNELLQKLHLNASQVIRTKEKEYVEAGLTKLSSEQDCLQALIKFPKLLQRPIFVHGKKAVIGRPPENILGLL
ncbi:MAG: arsenate reductase (glutaredoxin) [Gammaproteobacteria bacterium CG22_combo_CG10-13_8_21_14_all_40_8]|nr:MAG: arsenate reductase (glutaredoxin) [Gammaproteobacteria bacterium CG22_combo_CG10-13_8_21_14_all_40_8]